MSIAAVILAAGFSRRLGRPKQTLELAGETLLARTIRIARQAGLAPILVVVQDHSLAQTLPPDIELVLNPEAAEGIASSIRQGIAQAENSKVEGAVLLTCDQIAVDAAHLQSLCTHPTEPTGSAYAGKIGIPAYFPASHFPALQKLHGDTGARDLLRNARSVPTEALAFDIDTEADIQAAQQMLDSKGP